jgi:hypothetical protein
MASSICRPKRSVLFTRSSFSLSPTDKFFNMNCTVGSSPATGTILENCLNVSSLIESESRATSCAVALSLPTSSQGAETTRSPCAWRVSPHEECEQRQRSLSGGDVIHRFAEERNGDHIGRLVRMSDLDVLALSWRTLRQLKLKRS